MNRIKVDGREIELSNPDKLLFPDEKITKKDLVLYYRKISDYILPFIKDRPMMMHRYPDGINDRHFYQKNVPGYFPEWINTIRVPVKKNDGETQKFVNCDSEAVLAYTASQACITPHVFLSRKGRLHHPDKLIYDIDPDVGEFEMARECAADLNALFQTLELTAFVMTTGSKGLHVVLPLDGKTAFKTTRQFAKDAATLLAGQKPDKYTTQMRKKNRGKRVFLDYLRNSHGATAVAPYALRARKGAPVATPLSWDEIENKKIESQTFHHGNIFYRLGQKTDPWKAFAKTKNHLEKARTKLDELISEAS